MERALEANKSERASLLNTGYTRVTLFLIDRDPRNCGHETLPPLWVASSCGTLSVTATFTQNMEINYNLKKLRLCVFKLLILTLS